MLLRMIGQGEGEKGRCIIALSTQLGNLLLGGWQVSLILSVRGHCQRGLSCPLPDVVVFAAGMVYKEEIKGGRGCPYFQR